MDRQDLEPPAATQAAARYPSHRGFREPTSERGSAAEAPALARGMDQSPSWAAVEEEAQSRWNRALQVSPKVTSEPSRRSTREDGFVRRELEALEEKLSRQVMRLQEQSERFMDIMMHPLESKVAALEGRQPAVDCSLAELRGNLKGLQDSLEMQVRRGDQAETRLRKWRKTVEDDLQAKHTELKQKLTEAQASNAHAHTHSDVVTRAELVDVAKMLKQELRRLVADSVQGGGDMATRKELAAVAVHLREELTAVERVAAAAHNVPAHKELSSAAEAVRAEMRSLTERAAREENGSSAAVRELEKASDAMRRAVSDLSERLSRSERMQEESSRELRQLREELRRSTAREGQLMQVEAEARKWEPAVAALASRLTSLEDGQRRGHEVDTSSAVARMWEPAVAALTSRLQALEERQHSTEVDASSSVAGKWEPAVTALTSRLQALEERLHSTEAVATAAKELRDVHGADVVRRLDALEEKQCSLSQSLQATSQAELGECLTEDSITDSQLMLLDLQRRVVSIERKGQSTYAPSSEATTGAMQMNTATSPQASISGPGTPALTEVAQLAESLALNLRLARRVAGPSSAQASARSYTAASPRQIGNEDASPLPPLPPVAAMKVMASPRLQQLSISPRLQSNSSYSAYAGNGEAAIVPGTFNLAAASTPSAVGDSTALCMELRAEVAAVWDALAELAELLGDSSPATAMSGRPGAGLVPPLTNAGLGGAPRATEADSTSAATQAEECKRTLSSVNDELEVLRGSVHQLDARVSGCERKLQDLGGKEIEPDMFATFDARHDRGMFSGSGALAPPVHVPSEPDASRPGGS
eukprot:gb/GFBE01068361.1/.p1 GENE.gb/GFBE01068361.1/~~gb/GFBE01068361.1/.p1  ORF type:complete len:823 (+),score=192.03 gb/GFBE01068361.1/:1-2469(+)